MQRYVEVGIFEEPPWRQGISAEEMINDREARLGVRFDHQLWFQSVWNLDYDSLAAMHDAGRHVILNILFEAQYPVLRDIAAGVFDHLLIPFARKMKNGARQFTIRTLHEHNGNWVSTRVTIIYEQPLYRCTCSKRDITVS